MVTPAEAEALIRQHLVCLPVESLPLPQCMGAVLRENIYAERDQPPFDRVAMDGIAIDSGAWNAGRREFHVEGVQAAGDPNRKLAAADDCLEVMTGAVLPQGCDTVIPSEQLELVGELAQVRSEPEVRSGQNVHKRASDGRQGDLLLEAGTLLRAPEIDRKSTRLNSSHLGISYAVF